MNNGKFTAEDIYLLLYNKFTSHEGSEWLCANEVGDRTGASHRRLDFVACNCFASNGHAIYAYEVKISKSDLRNELFHPEKHNIFFDNIDYFSIVAPDYVLDAEYVALVPKQWGVVKAVAGTEEAGTANKLITVRKPLALHDERDHKIARSFAMCLMRRLRSDPSLKDAEGAMRQAAWQDGFETGKRFVPNVGYEELYRKEADLNSGLRRALTKLGVDAWSIHDAKSAVDAANAKAEELEKLELIEGAVRSAEWTLNSFRRTLSQLERISAPLLEAKAVAEKEAEKKNKEEGCAE